MGLWSWAKDRGKDIEESRLGGAILSMNPSVGMSTGGEGVQFQAGLNQGPGSPLATYDVGQAGQQDVARERQAQAGQGRDWGGTFMNLLPALAQSVGTYQQLGREEKDRERMADAQSRANLVNLVAGRNVMSPEYTPSKVGGLEKLAKVGGQALQVGQQQRAQADQAKLRELQIKAAQGNVAAQADLAKERGLELRRQEATDAARAAYYGDTTAAPEDSLMSEARVKSSMSGADSYAELVAKFGRDEADKIIAQREAEAARRSEVPFTTQPAEKPAVPVDPTADFTDRQRGIYQEEFARLGNEQTKRERDEQLFNLQTEAARANIDLTKIKTEYQKALSEMPDTSAVLGVASAFGTVMPGLSEDEFFNSPAVINAAGNLEFTPAQKSAMFATYKVAALDREMALSQADQERVDKFHAKLIKEPTIQIRNDVRQAMTEVITAFEEKGAPGLTDIQLLKLLARMQDPGSVVREAEYNTLAQALGVFQRAGIFIQKIEKGDKLDDEARQTIFNLALSAYRNRMADIDRIATGYIESETMPQFGRDSPEYVQMFQIASNPFRLPEIEKAKLNEILGHRERFFTPPGGSTLLSNLGKVNPQVAPGAPAQGDSEAYLRQHAADLEELDYPGITKGRDLRRRNMASPLQF